MRPARFAWVLAASLLLSHPISVHAQEASSEAEANTARAILADSQAALRELYAENPKARELGERARAIMIFPRIVKAGLMVGGQSGDGVLLEGDKVAGFYNISAGSFGFQAGAQTFRYALFFITESSLDYLKRSKGWAIGSGPSVVVMDSGMAKSITSTTLSQDVYAIPFGARGLMAGTGIEGSKITQIYPPPG